MGNGWIEKSPLAFQIAGGQTTKIDVTSGYRDNLSYRTASEVVLEVEASVEFTLSALLFFGLADVVYEAEDETLARSTRNTTIRSSIISRIVWGMPPTPAPERR